MFGYLMLVSSQKPYLYLEVPTKRFFNDFYHNTSIIVHLMWFPAVSAKKKCKRSSNQDVKGISKSQWPSFKTSFYCPITLQKWWVFAQPTKCTYNRLLKSNYIFQTMGKWNFLRFFEGEKTKILVEFYMHSDLFSSAQSVNQDGMINHCSFNLFHASINKKRKNS